MRSKHTIVCTDGREVDIETPASKDIFGTEWSKWLSEHELHLRAHTESHEIVVDTRFSKLPNDECVPELLSDAVPAGVKVTVFDGTDDTTAEKMDESGGRRSPVDTGDDSPSEPPETGFDWTDMPLEDRLHWVENWDDVDEGKILDVEHDDETFYATVELPWGETFTEEYDIPIPGDTNEQLTKLAEHCGYNLTTVEEIAGSSVPIVTSNDTGEWIIARNPRPADETTSTEEVGDLDTFPNWLDALVTIIILGMGILAFFATIGVI